MRPVELDRPAAEPGPASPPSWPSASSPPACGGASEGERRASPTKTLEDEGLDRRGRRERPRRRPASRAGRHARLRPRGRDHGGFCLPEGQLAISGMMVVRAIYDTLTVPERRGRVRPVPRQVGRAQRRLHRVDHHAPRRHQVPRRHRPHRRGRQEQPRRLPRHVPGPQPAAVHVRAPATSRPSSRRRARPSRSRPRSRGSPSRPSSTARRRIGIMAQAQLDDAETCDRKLDRHRPVQVRELEPEPEARRPSATPTTGRSPRTASRTRTPTPSSSGRSPTARSAINALESGDVNIIHTSNAEDIGGKLNDLRERRRRQHARVRGRRRGGVRPAQRHQAAVRRHPHAPGPRHAAPTASEINEIRTTACPPWPTARSPRTRSATSRTRASRSTTWTRPRSWSTEYVAERRQGRVHARAPPPTPTVGSLAELIQQRAKAIGVKVKIVKRDQAALIDDAIGGKYQAMLFRNYPGGDPDINYVWWYGADGQPGELRRLQRPRDQPAPRRGPQRARPAKRKRSTRTSTSEFAKQVWSIWSWFTPWAIVEKPNVHNILGPPLPGDDPSKPGEATTDDPSSQPTTGPGHRPLAPRPLDRQLIPHPSVRTAARRAAPPTA